MKTTLLLQAQYNQAANRDMFNVFDDLIKQGKQELLYKDCGLYYKSIIGTTEHIICGNIGLFIGQLGKELGIAHAQVDDLLALLEPTFTLKAALSQDIKQLSALNERVDALILESITNTNDFSHSCTLRLGKDFQVTKTRAHLILSLLNHATHHRGNIAGALDIMGIDNDFAGMLTRTF